VALAMALGAAGKVAEVGPSIYEKGGLVLI
jgi:hypothetical protein